MAYFAPANPEQSMRGQSVATEVVIAGGGLAGMAAAFELLEAGKMVLIIDKDTEDRFGGLARESFGGVHMIDTPEQRRLRLKDSPELALNDWLRYAEFEEDDALPREWARFYCENSREYIYDFLTGMGVKFLPIVNWPERGLRKNGNSVPRWHIAWGTGFHMIERMRRALHSHPKSDDLTVRFECEVSGLEMSNGTAVGVYGRSLKDGAGFRITAEHVVIASGGICGGDLSTLRTHWYEPWGSPPQKILNGAHDFADGLLHDQAATQAGANVTHLDKQWHYAAGVHHPERRRPNDGLSLVPPRSALWFNAEGARIMNPGPLVAYTDTRHLVESILREPGAYSWQVLNRKIALRELAVSGSDFMTAVRERRRLKMVRDLLFGNRELVDRLLDACPDDFLVADSLDELAGKMDAASLHGLRVDRERLKSEVAAYDAEVERGAAPQNDEQLRRLREFRRYLGDRLRICKRQKIDDPAARPLIAIREFILSRKSLGGIQTDLGSRVIGRDGTPIRGLYAAGEAAGFGGGGIHGKRSLEGTFLGGCILTGRVAGKTIACGG